MGSGAFCLCKSVRTKSLLFKLHTKPICDQEPVVCTAENIPIALILLKYALFSLQWNVGYYYSIKIQMEYTEF